MVALAGALAACADAITAAPSEFPVRFSVSNNLIAPITISIDGTPYIALSGGQSSPVTVSSKVELLKWTSAKPMDAHGTPIPDDVGEIRVGVGGINGVLDITNVIQDKTYITARIFNLTSAWVSIGVFDGSNVTCVSVLPRATVTGSGFTLTGYYRLTANTEIRAYHDPLGCTGSYVSWPTSQLKSFEPKSGLVTLELDTAP